MLLESLKLLVHAGEDALMTTCRLPVEEVTIAQIRQGQITFPAMGKIVFQGGTLQNVRLGADSILCGHLSELVDDSQHTSGIEQLTKRFMSQALEEMEGRYPRGQIENLDVGPQTVFTRGVRSFGLKFLTSMGQLFLMAELPSRYEFEQAKGSEYLSGMISTYLPGNWAGRDFLSSRSELDSLLVFLRKVEGDVHVTIPVGDDRFESRTGLLLEQCTYADQRALRVNLNLEHGPARLLKVGDTVASFVGVQDRSLEMDLKFLGAEDYTVVGGAVLQTALFALPEKVFVSQRRRAFRIDLFSTVPVELEPIDEDCTSTLWFGDEELFTGVTGNLVDLSFSGARIVGDANELCPNFPEGSRVKCRIFFPDESRPLQVLGLVRRSGSKMVARDTYQDELGIEFLVAPDIDRHSLDIIRQYVLKEQRSLLARRVHVSGSV
jgi:hypothetical protein